MLGDQPSSVGIIRSAAVIETRPKAAADPSAQLDKAAQIGGDSISTTEDNNIICMVPSMPTKQRRSLGESYQPLLHRLVQPHPRAFYS